MLRVLIAGAGNFGREIADGIDGYAGANAEWKFSGFLSDIPDALKGYDFPEQILGTIADYQPQPDDRIVVAISDPGPKMQVAERLKQRGAKFLSLVHRSAVVCRRTILGEGVVIAPLAYVGGGAVLGDFVVLNVNATVGHDTRIGEGCTLSSHCDLTGHVELGKGVFLATHACVIPKVRVGDGAFIGAGSVVIRHVPAGSRVFGVPARNIAIAASHDKTSPSTFSEKVCDAR
ncbi:MAG: acetyltransferase [Planctomycetales bacterium]|jgi:sugar O-acyltransferase (sialic acid O-acetyltransferase NeuD family)|nr:acetyltransferase [Planctomycetales bacterium]